MADQPDKTLPEAEVKRLLGAVQEQAAPFFAEYEKALVRDVFLYGKPSEATLELEKKAMADWLASLEEGDQDA